MDIDRFSDVRGGDLVTYRDRFGALKSARAQPLLCQPWRGTIVVNLGGAYGTPGVVTPTNFVRARRKVEARRLHVEAA